MQLAELKAGIVVEGPFFPEPVHVLATVPMDDSLKLIGKGTKTNQVSEPILDSEQIAALAASPETEPYDGDATHFWLGVEAENRGFDLVSRRPHPEDPKTALEVRLIEVKGRSERGEVALTANEYRTARRLRQDYWLYVVFNCATSPTVNVIRDPAQLDWEPVVKIEHYRLKTESAKHPVELRQDGASYDVDKP